MAGDARGFNPFHDGNGRAGRGRDGGPLGMTALPPGSMTAIIRRAAGRGPRGTLPAGALRDGYTTQVAQIPALNAAWVTAGWAVEERATMAHTIRHDARNTARAGLNDLAVMADLKGRDQTTYGTPDGPTFAHQVADGTQRGRTGEDIFTAIIGGPMGHHADDDATFATKAGAR